MTQAEESLTRQQLMEFLDSEDNVSGLDSMATHGFLTAVTVGKTLPTWLSDLFEGDADISEPVKKALINWQTELLTDLKNEELIELPFADKENIENDEEMGFTLDSDISVWAVGFVDAMYAENAEDWFNDQETEDDVAMLTLPMVVLSGVDEEDETLQDIRSDDDLLAQMVNNLERNLTELFLLFHTND